MNASVVLFTADLRLHDHPPLRAALDGSREIVPLFVRDPAVDRAGFAVPNRLAFLADCLRDLDAGLRERGGRLVVRSGGLVEEVCKVAAEADAEAVHVAADVSGHAQRREERLRRALEADGRRLQVHDAVTAAVPAGAVTPAASDHYAVFTPYFRQWSRQPLRDAVAAPRTVRVPDGVGSEPLPGRDRLSGVSRGLAAGGETEGRRRLAAWLRACIASYEERHDDLAGDATSRLSPHLHFGTLSPVELVHRARRAGGPGAEAFVRQLAWRDFHRQVLAARPAAATADYRTKHDRWRTEQTAAEDIEAWRTGRTGYPVVDAAMRQLLHEGWMHNRGRLLTASFLAKTLYVDWRVGARHFLELLVDGDVANNQLNWQWVAGTGTDTRPNRVLNPLAQAKRYDPDGAYVRRWVPELERLAGSAVHEPWKAPAPDRATLGYPEPIIDLADGLDRFRRARERG
ncbi:deoxyribodipyrimidine photo-lyase type I [Streptomyces sp. Ag109_O5-1]|uniref:cryptochrome/photolyase family protein n=1 Tax=Streptomyces sp. Ag109_O5-1 TaxID=1938851 RepID=UPI000F515BC6|nr:deoxyribodipyrimidine photo-lyase [Streptomyces sp. Ag109_O5-1]RPE37690.1 deoxyribodipyrimidine photo-lyase type I [Streptomyces sp. Ag109_O5-1]